MNIIFLDIDGVLNTPKTRCRCCGYRGIDDDKVKALASIVGATGAKIVLISTWKDFWQKDYKSFQGEMANYLDKKLKKQGLAVTDKTRDKNGAQYFSRGQSILDYLCRHAVKDFLILDDLQYDYDGCDLTDRLIKTDPRHGLTARLAEKAIAALCAKKQTAIDTLSRV